MTVTVESNSVVIVRNVGRPAVWNAGQTVSSGTSVCSREKEGSCSRDLHLNTENILKLISDN